MTDETLTFDLVAHQPELGEVAYSLAIRGEDAKQTALDAGFNPACTLAKAEREINLDDELTFQEVPPPGTPQQVYKIGQIEFASNCKVVSSDFDPEKREHYFVGKGNTGQPIGPDEPADA